jgi:hypothetical protein
VLSDAQYLAGLRYAVVVGEYRAVIETPRAMSGAGRGYTCPADPRWGRDGTANARSVRRAMTRPSRRCSRQASAQPARSRAWRCMAKPVRAARSRI